MIYEGHDLCVEAGAGVHPTAEAGESLVTSHDFCGINNE
jgi:hypothetical protein